MPGPTPRFLHVCLAIVSLAALPLIEVTQRTVTTPASVGAWLREIDNPAALIREPAPLRGWQRLYIVPPQRDQQRDDLVCKVDGHGAILPRQHRNLASGMYTLTYNCINAPAKSGS